MDKQIIMRWWQVPRAEIPDGPRGADRLALRLVGADRRLDRTEPAEGSLLRPAPLTSYCCELLVSCCARPRGGRRSRSTSAGSSGVVTGWLSAAWSASASSGEAPPVSSTSVPAIGAAGVGGVAGVAGGAGVGTYDDCQLSALPPCSFFATKAATAASPVDQQDLLELAALLLLRRLALELGDPGSGQVTARGGLLGGEARPGRGLLGGERGTGGEDRRRLVAGVGEHLAGLLAGVGQGRSGLVAGVGEQRDGAVLGLLRGVHRGDDGGPDRSLHLGTDGLDVVRGLVDEGLLLAQAHGHDTSFSSCGFHSIMSEPTPASAPVLACMRGSGAHEPDRRNNSRTHFSERQSWRTSRPS